MKIEIVKHSVEIGARSSIVLDVLERAIRKLVLNVQKNALLRGISFLRSIEGIIVIAIAVNIVGVKFINILLELNAKVAAACRFRIKDAAVVPVVSYFWINK